MKKPQRLELLWLFMVAPPLFAVEDTVPLSGSWRFALDRADRGAAEEWYNRDLPHRIRLPGSLQEQGYGDDVSTDTPWTGSLNDRSWFSDDRYAPYRQPGNIKVPFWLQPEKYYVGAAWYQRWITIPESWSGKRVVLHLERPHWGTTVWLDNRRVGQQDGLCAPHEYDLGTAVAAGRRRLTIRVDNRLLVPVGVNAHSVSDHTQGNWNGVVGDLSLRVTEPVWIADVQAFPDVAARRVRVQVNLGNASGRPGSGTLKVSAQSHNSPDIHRPAAKEYPVDWSADGGSAELIYDLGAGAQLWDEFRPALYRLRVEVPGVTAPRVVTFGLREAQIAGRQIAVNGGKIFLRGTLECCIFPLHGYPPTDVGSWKRVLGAARAHGLNHLRFHSWCPPEAAFVAADEMGFYYQVECSAWSYVFNQGTKLDTWIYAEAERIVKHYGNHPSLLLLVPSNEPGGRGYQKFVGNFVDYWKAKDSRRLYSAGSGWPSIAENEFHVTPRARAFPVRAKLGETASDYSSFLAKQSAPIVSHEIGQYCVFPNLDEIPKYRGLLKARNFEIVRDFMDQAGMADQARDFLRASGRLQALFYKDEIEACLRTPGWAGFQLLDLHDFPGQGTALVGVLDPFWEEKGYIGPGEFRRFCDETVPLARLPKRIWTNDEVLLARVDVAHFGPRDLGKVSARWRVRDAAHKLLAQGQFPPATLARGSVRPLGEFELSLARFPTPIALNLEILVPGTRFANDWNFWVYPARLTSATPPGVTVTKTLDEAAVDALEAGGPVVVLADPRTIRGKTTGRFDPIFWNKLWFPSQPQHTLGLLMDPGHPALARFPTAFHSDWQWQGIQNHSRPVVLDGLPKNFRPIVQVIDDWNTCRKLGLVLEASVGKGRLLVCAADLDRDLDARPPARQLRASLLDYAASSRFQPAAELQLSQVQALFRELTLTEKLGARVIRTDSAHRGHSATLLLDGDPTTIWHTKWGEGAPGFPHEVVIGFDQTATLGGLMLLPRQDRNPNGWIKDYAIFLSDDGQNWGEPVARGTLEANSREKAVKFATRATGRFLKLVALSSFDPTQPYASLAELSVLPAGPLK